jgi:hypothetical protein
MSRISYNSIIFICIVLGATVLRAQVKVIDHKGNIRLIDTSKWSIIGSNISSKNSSNVGVGTTNPSAKLHTVGSLRFEGLATSATNNSLLTTDVSGNVAVSTISNLFSNNTITSLNGLTSSSQTYAVGNSGSDFNITSFGSLHTFNIPNASSTNRGLLTTIDWSTFNNKIGSITGNSPITATTSGDSTTLGINRYKITAGNSISTATNPLALDSGAINAVVGATDATITVNNTAPLWNADKIQNISVTNAIPVNGQVMKYNGTAWTPSFEAAATNWLVTGNNNTTTSNFLGTINDVRMQIRSNNTPMLEFGRRQTLGLTETTGSLFPYTDGNSSMVHVRGTGGVSALQFESSASAFYRPIFFTDPNGNFKMRGSSAGTDFFELGSSGASNNGRLDFIIGDDGDEPIVFSKYNYNPVATIEMMRLQGTGLNNSVRAGINVGGVTANSTLQVVGSLSLPIVTASGATFNATESMYTILLNSVTAIVLPNANSVLGRIYIIKNMTNAPRTITSYRDLSNIAQTTISANTTITIQSDGAVWHRVQ